MSEANKDLTRLKDRAAREILGGRWKNALELLGQARALAPRDTHVAMKIGDMHQRLGQRAEAIQAYKQAAALFAASGFLIKSISVHKIILSLDPGDREVQAQLAALYAEPGQEGPVPLGIPMGVPPVADFVVEPSFDIDLAAVDRKALPRTPLFSDLTGPELEQIIEKLVPVFAAAGTVVCVDGEKADSMYVIVRGSVRVSGRDAAGNVLWLTNLGEGQFFGEFGLLGDGRRHADVVAAEDTELLEIAREHLDQIGRDHPHVLDVLFRFYKQRVVDTLLAKSDTFRGLQPQERRELVELAALDARAAGEVILEEGRPGEHLYLIKSGEVEVFSGMGDRRVDLAVLAAGQVFGEISLLTGTPATATVVARSAVELVRFTRPVVMAVAEVCPDFAHRLTLTKDNRVHDTVHRLQVEGFV